MQRYWASILVRHILYSMGCDRRRYRYVSERSAIVQKCTVSFWDGMGRQFYLRDRISHREHSQVRMKKFTRYRRQIRGWFGGRLG